VPQIELPERTHELIGGFIASGGESTALPLRQLARSA
jgi:hypothetical protein